MSSYKELVKRWNKYYLKEAKKALNLPQVKEVLKDIKNHFKIDDYGLDFDAHRQSMGVGTDIAIMVLYKKGYKIKVDKLRAGFYIYKGNK